MDTLLQGSFVYFVIQEIDSFHFIALPSLNEALEFSFQWQKEKEK